MKKMLLCVITVLCFVNITEAQTKSNTILSKKETDLVELFKRADLNDDQQIKSRAVITAYDAQISAIKTDATIAITDKKYKIELLMIEQDIELKEIMGAPQFKAFETGRRVQKDFYLKNKN